MCHFSHGSLMLGHQRINLYRENEILPRNKKVENLEKNTSESCLWKQFQQSGEEEAEEQDHLTLKTKKVPPLLGGA